MREIKFRVWDKDNNKYLLWDEIWHSILKIPVNALPNQEDELLVSFFGMTTKSPKYVVQQYIGLEDKNGTPIYEGDILNNGRGNIFIIESKLDANCGCCDRIWGWSVPSCLGESREVVGNIFENPELSY